MKYIIVLIICLFIIPLIKDNVIQSLENKRSQIRRKNHSPSKSDEKLE